MSTSDTPTPTPQPDYRLPDYQTRKREIYEFMKDQYDKEISCATYLMTAQAACIAACLTVLKDSAALPQFKGAGFFLKAFIGGFLLACVGYVALIAIRGIMLATVMASGPSTKIPTRYEHYAHIPLFISAGVLFWGLWEIAKKLSAL